MDGPSSRQRWDATRARRSQMHARHVGSFAVTRGNGSRPRRVCQDRRDKRTRLGMCIPRLHGHGHGCRFTERRRWLGEPRKRGGTGGYSKRGQLDSGLSVPLLFHKIIITAPALLSLKLPMPCRCRILMQKPTDADGTPGHCFDYCRGPRLQSKEHKYGILSNMARQRSPPIRCALSSNGCYNQTARLLFFRSDTQFQRYTSARGICHPTPDKYLPTAANDQPRQL